MADGSQTPRRKRDWTRSELHFLRHKVGVLSHKQIGESLGRSKNAVATKASALGWCNSLTRWSPEDSERLCALVGTMSDARIAVQLGRTVASVRERKRFLKLIVPQRKWTAEEVETLMREWPVKANRSCVAKTLNWSRQACRSRYHLELKRKK